jgi:hypothetical protein
MLSWSSTFYLISVCGALTVLSLLFPPWSICFISLVLLSRAPDATDVLTFVKHANCAFSYILLAPRDKDHYSPILDLERTLYTIIERE